MSANQLTGVKYDLNEEKIKLILETIALVEPKIKSLQERYENDENLRDDCMLLYSGHINANALTPHLKSEEGECAVFQEVKCKIVSS